MHGRQERDCYLRCTNRHLPPYSAFPYAGLAWIIKSNAPCTALSYHIEPNSTHGYHLYFTTLILFPCQNRVQYILSLFAFVPLLEGGKIHPFGVGFPSRILRRIRIINSLRSLAHTENTLIIYPGVVKYYLRDCWKSNAPHPNNYRQYIKSRVQNGIPKQPVWIRYIVKLLINLVTASGCSTLGRSLLLPSPLHFPLLEYAMRYVSLHARAHYLTCVYSAVVITGRSNCGLE